MTPLHHATARRPQTMKRPLAAALLMALAVCSSCRGPQIDITLLDRRTRLEEEIRGTYQPIGRSVPLAPTPQALGLPAVAANRAVLLQTVQQLQAALDRLSKQPLPAGESPSVCRARLHYNLFAAYAQSGQAEQALGHLEQAEAIADSRRMFGLLWKVQYERALLQTEGRTDALVEAATALYDERPPFLLPNDPLDRRMRQALVGHLVDGCTADGDPVQAVDAVETGAALDMCLFLAGLRRPPQPEGAPEGYARLIEAREAVVSKHRELLLHRATNESDAKLARARQAFAEALVAYQEAEGAMSYARFDAQLRNYFGFEGVQASEGRDLGLVTQGTAYLRYYLRGRILHIWQVYAGSEEEDEDQGQGIDHTQVQLTDAVIATLASLRGRPLAWEPAQAAALAQVLIAPIAEKLTEAKVTRAYIAAPPELMPVPWPALPYGKGVLCERVQLAFVTSVAELSMAYENPPLVKRSLLFCPSAAGDDRLRDVVTAEFEDTVVLAGEALDSRRLLAAAARTNVIHLGRPYYLCASRPWESHLALSDPRSLQRTRLAEMASVALARQIVLLSHTDAATLGGQESQGPLYRTVDALTAAGAATVVAAWPGAGNTGADPVWQDFYLELASRPPGEALRLAQVKALRSRPASKAWAAVRLFGHLGPTDKEAEEHVEVALDSLAGARARAVKTQDWAEVLRLAKQTALLLNILPDASVRDRMVCHKKAADAAARAFLFDAAVEHGHEWARLAQESGDERETIHALFNLGIYCSKAEHGQYKEAAEYVEQAIRRLPAGAASERIGKLRQLAQIHRKFQAFPKSIQTIEDALALAQKQGRGNVVAQLYYDLGTIYLRHLNAYPDAEKRFEEARKAAEGTGDGTMEAKCYLALGIVRHRLGDFGPALERLDQALRLAQRFGVKGLQAEALLERANVGWYRADYSRALEEVQAALDINQRIHNEPLWACTDHVVAHLQQASAAARKSEYEPWQAEVKAALQLGDKVGDPPRFLIDRALAGLYFVNAAWLQRDLNRPRTAMSAALESEARRAHNTQDSVRLRALNTQGLIYWTLNDHEQALTHLEAALALAQQMHERQEVDVREDQASTRNNLGLIRRDQKHYDQALAHFRQALESDVQLQSKWGQAYSHKNLGMTYRRMGKLAKAEEHLTQSVALARGIGDKTSQVKALCSLGNVYADQGRREDAEKSYRAALGDARSAQIREIEWRSLWGLGRLARKAGDRAEAYRQFKAAIEVVEGMRAAIKIEEYRNGFVANKLTLYEDIILLLLDEGKNREAFDYSERSRARSFIDLLGSQLSAKVEVRPITARRVQAVLLDSQGRSKDDKTPSNVALVEYFITKHELIIWVIRGDQVAVVRTRAEKLRREVLRKRSRRTATATPGAAEAKLDIASLPASEAIGDAVLELRRLIQRVEDLEGYPRLLHDALFAPVRPYLQDPKSRENDCQYVCIVPHGVLHYLPFAALHDGANYLVERHSLFYAPSASVLQFTMDRARPLSAMVPAAGRIQPDDVLDWQALCSTLSQQGQATAASPGRRIWSGLPAQVRAAVTRGAGGQKLDAATQTAIAQALSAAMEKHDLFRTQDVADLALPMDVRLHMAQLTPDAAKADAQRVNRLVLQAAYPQTLAKASRQLKVLAIGNPYLGSRNLDLPFAAREVESIPWNFALSNPGWATQTASPGEAGQPQSTWRFPNITVLTGDKATEGWVKEHVGEYHVLHVATHGEFDTTNPLLSCLRLAGDPQHGLDGRLDVQDVFDIRLNTDLVILSACQSGLGKVETGDEVIGLNRAFFYAGTQAIVSSLWRVSDVTTGIMVKHFYRRYGKANKADSLCLAQQQVKNDPVRREYRHPAYWAAFILVGDYR